MTSKTKTILTYLGGVLTGVVLTFVFAFMVGTASSSAGDVVMFDKPLKEISGSFEVLQVLPNGNALAMAKNNEDFGLVVLFLADKDVAYYDDMKVETPAGKRLMQVGTFKYITAQEIERTVPVVEFLE